MATASVELREQIRSHLLIQKYGGTSVESPERIKAVADHIAKFKNSGESLVVVVSAMGKTTDELINLAYQVSTDPQDREMDMLLTAGERISMALLSMALHDLGIDAISFTGSQAGIVTDTTHGKAQILDIKAQRICEALEQNKVCVVAGFQGISTNASITTLGRGGSDTTAVALAAALGAKSCEIYTDVTGVFTSDPRVVANATKINRLNFDEMLEISATGGRVLALRAVEFARKYNVPLHVRSSFSLDEQGTIIDGQENKMEEAVVSAVTHDTSEVKFTIKHVKDQPGIAATVFGELAKKNLNVDMIMQNTANDGSTDISFTVPSDEKPEAEVVLGSVCKDIGANGFECDELIGRISIVGAGMKSQPGIAAAMFETLADHNINIQMISTSTIRISVVVDSRDVERGMAALHDKFDLEIPAQSNSNHLYR